MLNLWFDIGASSNWLHNTNTYLNLFPNPYVFQVIRMFPNGIIHETWCKPWFPGYLIPLRIMCLLPAHKMYICRIIIKYNIYIALAYQSPTKFIFNYNLLVKYFCYEKQNPSYYTVLCALERVLSYFFERVLYGTAYIGDFWFTFLILREISI